MFAGFGVQTRTLQTLKLEENELKRQSQLRSYEIDENTHFSSDNGETNMPSEDLIPISM